ncbi:MAG: DHH family phosphoesterase [Candidatus Woesearchaeota archaeon]
MILTSKGEEFEDSANSSIIEFKKACKEIAQEFKKIPKSENIRVISHLDADGISSAALIVKALNRENRPYSLTILQQVKSEDVKKFSLEEAKNFIFTDLGSNQISQFLNNFNGKKVFILDHHQPENSKNVFDFDLLKSRGIYHLNPHLFSIDGSSQISGSGVSYYFVKELNSENEDLAHIALIGTLGDIQEPSESILNSEILELAKKHKRISVTKGLKVFGAQTKPLHMALVQSTEIYIPGVTGSESGAIQFLKQINIEPKEGNRWRRIIDLSEEELKRLVEGIIMLRLNEENPEDIIGDIYLLNDEEEGSTLKDAREFATVLNACGRLNRASLGVGACLGDKRLKNMAVETLKDYKKEIVSALKWFEQNRNSNNVIQEPGFLIINAEDKILSTIIGTVASIISKSGIVPKNTFVVAMARMMNDYTKISIRYSGNNLKDEDYNLKEIISRVIDDFEGEAGGHINAAGAYIPVSQESMFIEKLRVVLRRFALEEKID